MENFRVSFTENIRDSSSLKPIKIRHFSSFPLWLFGVYLERSENLSFRAKSLLYSQAFIAPLLGLDLRELSRLPYLPVRTTRMESYSSIEWVIMVRQRKESNVTNKQILRIHMWLWKANESVLSCCVDTDVGAEKTPRSISVGSCDWDWLWNATGRTKIS